MYNGISIDITGSFSLSLTFKHVCWVSSIFIFSKKKKTPSNDDKSDPDNLAEDRQCCLRFIKIEVYKRASKFVREKNGVTFRNGLFTKFDFSSGTRSQGAL
jgi:hypothetical protein